MATKDISDLQVVQAVAAWKANGDRPADKYLMEATNQPQKVCERAMERALNRGLYDYGVTFNTGWLTDAGKALLNAEKRGD